jgi:hypothetical protein
MNNRLHAELLLNAETERPEDLVERRFEATAPNQLWVAD